VAAKEQQDTGHRGAQEDETILVIQLDLHVHVSDTPVSDVILNHGNVHGNPTEGAFVDPGVGPTDGIMHHKPAVLMPELWLKARTQQYFVLMVHKRHNYFPQNNTFETCGNHGG
jgi:hypothetical protein